MFDANRVLIDAFVSKARRAYRETYPDVSADLEAGLERAARIALTTLRNCDCPYHDLEHTLLVTDAGMEILRGRQLARGNVSPSTWLQAVTALLFHDLGYLRGLLGDDRDGAYVADENGQLVTPPPGATDAFMMPYHVARGRLFVTERFAGDPVIDGVAVASYIEMTRFPVPDEAFYQQLDSIGALVRAADLIGQMADPGYPMKQARLFAEFKETGEASRLGYDNPAELRADFPTFFYRQVYPYLPPALDYLGRTTEGGQWIANLVCHLHNARSEGPAGTGSDTVLPRSLEEFKQRLPDDAPAKPQIAVNNA
ncbi:MAG: metal-dependent phosphohydrolase [Gammaproteobacteria bacterium]|nr:metal-dependent phosphohydrolase [Gammaproteobacteria bacterium]